MDVEPIQKCRCYGRYEGCDHGEGPWTCPAYGPGRRSPYFCGPCDERRVEHVHKNLKEVHDLFGKVD